MNFGSGESVCAVRCGGRRPVPVAQTREPPRASVGWAALASGAAPRRTLREGSGILQLPPRCMHGVESPVYVTRTYVRRPRARQYVHRGAFGRVLLVRTACGVCIGAPGAWGSTVGPLRPVVRRGGTGDRVGRYGGGAGKNSGVCPMGRKQPYNKRGARGARAKRAQRVFLRREGSSVGVGEVWNRPCGAARWVHAGPETQRKTFRQVYGDPVRGARADTTRSRPARNSAPAPSQYVG